MAETHDGLPAIHGFPPFFTRQPHAATWERQCALWCELILAHCRAHARWVLPLGDEGAPWANPAIRRSLPADVRRAVVDALAERGDAAWLADERGFALVFLRPLADLASALVDYVRAEHYSATGAAVLTYYELFEDEAAAGLPFHGLPSEAALYLLRWMAARGSVVFMGPPSAGVRELGLKFRL